MRSAKKGAPTTQVFQNRQCLQSRRSQVIAADKTTHTLIHPANFYGVSVTPLGAGEGYGECKAWLGPSLSGTDPRQDPQDLLSVAHSSKPHVRGLSPFNPTFTHSASLQNLHIQSILFFLKAKPHLAEFYKLKSC